MYSGEPAATWLARFWIVLPALFAGSVVLLVYAGPSIVARVASHRPSADDRPIEPAIVRIDSVNSVAIGSSVDVTVAVEGAPNSQSLAAVSAYEVELAFDPSILEYLAHTPGTFRGRGIDCLAARFREEPPLTIAELTCVPSGSTGTGRNGGSLVVVRMRGVGPGVSPLTLRDDTHLITQTADILMATLVSGQIAVTGAAVVERALVTP